MVTWLLAGAFVVSLIANITLWLRIREERVERRYWKRFVSEMPDDLTGVEQFDPTRYTARGRRLYPWFLGSSILTMVLFFAAVTVFFR